MQRQLLQLKPSRHSR